MNRSDLTGFEVCLVHATLPGVPMEQDPRQLPRSRFDPLVCGSVCRYGRDIPYGKIEEQVARALDRSGGKITPPVLKPIRKYFDRYMPLPSKANDLVYKRLEATPVDPRSVQAETELALIEHLYRTLKQDFTVSLIMRFADPRQYGAISQPIRKAVRWMGVRIHEKRSDHEYVALMRELRKLRDSLKVDRVADVERGLYSLYYQCLVGEGHNCTNFEALARSKRHAALARLGSAARQAENLRQLFDDAREKLDELEGDVRDSYIQRLVSAVGDFSAELVDELESSRAQQLEGRLNDIKRTRDQIKKQYPCLAHLGSTAVELLAGAVVLWNDEKKGANLLPGLIAVSCGQAFEHELRMAVFARMGNAPAPDGAAYSWLAQTEPLVAGHPEGSSAWLDALKHWSKPPKFETIEKLVLTSADPALGSSNVVRRFQEALFRSFPKLRQADGPEDFGPSQFANKLSHLRVLRNRCVHVAGKSATLGLEAAELVFGETGILTRLSKANSVVDRME